MKNKKNLDGNKVGVQYITVGEEYSGQRIDNYLLNKLKNVPKSFVYRIIRRGEVRVNKRRVHAFYRILDGDSIRLPPIFLDSSAKQIPPSKATTEVLKDRVLYEDKNLLVLNKPSGISVHAGSTIRVGVIEIMRYLFPTMPHLELAHRLDSETSGCLIMGKKRSILRELHELLRQGKITKVYWALTKNHWKDSELQVKLPLRKEYKEGGKKHVVEVHKMGKEAFTEFHPLRFFKDATLVEVRLHTGRTHQIRVHAAHLKHPIAGDDRYGEKIFNQECKKLGLKRMFLHARSVDFTLPSLNQHIRVIAPLDDELESFLKILKEE